MKKIKLVLFLFGFFSLFSYAQTSWDFTGSMQGWHDMGDGRDVAASWENGNLKMTYMERSPTNGPQLWFPAIQVDNLNFNAADYPYLEIYYKAVNWPTTSSVKVLLTFTNSSNQQVYSYVSIDPKKTAVSIDIAAYDPTWGKTYTGTMKSLQLELPHNGDPASNPATSWFSAWTIIDKIVLTKTKNDFLPKKEELRWSFDNGYSDTNNTITALTTGNPTISTTGAKSGNGALLLSGTDYVTIPGNSILSSDKITYSFWVKTPPEGQKVPSNPSYLLSYGSGNFELAYYQGNLSIKEYRVWNNFTSSWNNNVWQNITLTIDGNSVTCYLNGKKAGETLNSSIAALRNGNLTLGINGLSAVIDELSIYNYLLTDTEIATIGSIPPATVAPWIFTNNLQGWHEIQDGTTRDINIAWNDGAMDMTYANKAVNNGPQLWFPQAEVFTRFDAGLYPFCDIYYQAVGWPVNTPIKGLLEIKKADNTICYSYFDVDPSKNFIHVDISKTNPGWGVAYGGEIVSVRLELPHNDSAPKAEDWFGASTKITKIEFNNAQPAVSDVWDLTIANSSFVKSGMDRFNSTKFQYLTIGLGGTTMRVDPWGFAGQRAPNANQTSYNWKPSFGYEYWWDNAGHRYNPFLIKSGYGSSFDPGTITGFEQKMDINTGVLKTNLTLIVGGTTFTSSRETFITPEGILVIRVQDNGAPSPIKLNLAINETVEWFGTYYAGTEAPFTKDAAHTSQRNSGATGGVVVTNRPNTADCAVAVAVESSSAPTVSANCDVYSQTSSNGVITFYIAPTSSYKPTTSTLPWDHAWNSASGAKQKGYEVIKQQTASWWKEYLNVSKVTIPDQQVSKLYTQSLYYHGIYFGNSAIPPGCFGTDIYGFFGAVCPEYDLTFSSFALAYTGRINETKNIASWVYSVLPKCKDYAVNGITSHNVFRKYDSGAIYTTLMGYDGAQTIPGEVFEGGNLECNYPGANAARMALNYFDYSDDQSFKSAAYDVLKSTTYVSLQDLTLNSKGMFLDGKRPNSMQQGAVLMGYDQCVKRGIADPAWITKYQNKILMPQGVLAGDTLLSAACGYNPQQGEGGATWFYPLWWATVVSKHDPRAVKAIQNYKGTFQDYCFNNGWSGVQSAKVYRGDDALMWLRNFQRPEVLLDETSFSENASPAGINYTPEIGAHGAYICNLTQMLIDPDDEFIIDIFPAIPHEWEYQKVGFEGLMATGALSFSAERDLNGLKMTVTNKATTARERKIRMKVPRFLNVLESGNFTIEDGFIVINTSLQPGETKTYQFTFGIPTDINTIGSDIRSNLFNIYPNPNSTGTLNISDSENINELQIYSMTGKLVRSFRNKVGSYPINELPSGIYLIQIKAGTKFYVRRLIVNR